MKRFGVLFILLLALMVPSLVSAAEPPPTDTFFGWVKCDGDGPGQASPAYFHSQGYTSGYGFVGHNNLGVFSAGAGTWFDGSPQLPCTAIADPGYTVPSGNVSAWAANNQYHDVTCPNAGSIGSVKVRIVEDNGGTYGKYQVYSEGGSYLSELARGPAPYPNATRSNTIRWSTTRCQLN